MDIAVWKKYKNAKKRFKDFADDLSSSLPDLKNILQCFVNSRSGVENSSYTVDTPVVYNNALDDITKDDEIKIILAADNPGRREQAAENRRYLTGPSGKIAAKFFINNPSLGIDFKKNVIILNKTPVHTPRTSELRDLCRAEDSRRNLKNALDSSQVFMASLLFEFHMIFSCPVWITGYSEMRKGGIFQTYTEKLKELYADNRDLTEKLFFYRHFSMNQFTIDLKQQSLAGETVKQSLNRIGRARRKIILERI